MRLSDIDHSKVGTLEEFIHLLKYGNPELLKTENVSDQSRLLDYFSFLMMNHGENSLQNLTNCLTLVMT